MTTAARAPDPKPHTASYLFSGVMAPAFYAARAVVPGTADCAEGGLCFRSTFLVLAGACAAAAAASALLAVRLRDLYDPTTGAPREYGEWRRHNPRQADPQLARIATRACLPLCCCACGRAMLREEEEGRGGEVGGGSGGASGRGSLVAAFEGDVSMGYLDTDAALDNEDGGGGGGRRSVASVSSTAARGGYY